MVLHNSLCQYSKDCKMVCIRDLSRAFKTLPRFKSKTPCITTLMPIN